MANVFAIEVLLQTVHEAGDTLKKLATCEGHDTCRFSAVTHAKCPYCRAREHIRDAALAIGKLKEWDEAQ